MKQITIAEVRHKSGTNDKGAYNSTQITDTEGSKWSTFADEQATLGVGDVVDIEMTLKDGVPVLYKEYVKFGKFTVIMTSAPGFTQSPLLPPPTGDGMTPEMWEEKDRIKRLSIERQSSLGHILSYIGMLAAAGTEPTKEEVAFKDKAITWGSSRYDDAPAVDTRTQADEDFDNLGRDSRFKNVGELLMWCGEEGIDRAAFLTIVGVKDTVGLDVSEAYQKVKDHLSEKG